MFCSDAPDTCDANPIPDKEPLARLLTTDPQINTSSLGMPDAFQPFAKPGWLPALLRCMMLQNPLMNRQSERVAF